MNKLIRILITFINSLLESNIINVVDGKAIPNEDVINNGDDFVNGIKYDRNGMSEPSQFGGVRLRPVDVLINQWRISPDPAQVQVARDTDPYLIWQRKGVAYTQEQLGVLISNQNRIKMTGAKIDDAYEYEPYYYNTETNERQWDRLSLPQMQSGKWRKDPNRLIGQIANHAVVVDGNNSEPDSLRYDEFVKSIPDIVLGRMKRDYKLLTQGREAIEPR